MNAKIHRSVDIFVDPRANVDRLFSQFDVMCPEARQSARQNPRDPYEIKVDFITIDGYLTLDKALSIAETFGKRRLLSLGELLALNIRDASIGSRYPIFTDEYVLEFVSENSILDPDELRDGTLWSIGSVGLKRGEIIDKDSLFATTSLTLVDQGLWTGNLLENFVSLTQQSINQPRA